MTEQSFIKNDGSESLGNDQFISLLTRHQKKIYGIIHMLIPYKPYAEDVMQETALVMWRKKDDFRPGSDFGAWGARIARFQVLKYCRKQKGSRLCFTDGALDEISRCHDAVSDRIQERLHVLDTCVTKLNQDDRNLINMRYVQELKASSIAEKVNRSVDGIYKAFSRIHLTLQNCVFKTLKAEESE
ncbi:MAG: sigma-70 family RNA polymerase sigma factor [Phycisphaerae bacterium]|nr:sigma-70 family RNA polymerase sigma factor [Phycisphaerae bacterium]